MTKVVFDVLSKEECQKTLVWLLSWSTGRIKSSVCRDFDIKYEIADQITQKQLFDIAASKYDSTIQQELSFVQQYQKEWDKIESSVFNAFNEVFGEELNMQNLTANLWPCFVCPYKKSGFWVQGLTYNWEKVKNIAIHEITHLYWWQKWEQTFANDPKMLDHTYHSAVWYLSEIAVHTIVNNSKLKEVLTNTKIANPGFYDIKIDAQDLFSKMDEIYHSSNNLKDFMEKGLEFVEDNLVEIKNENQIVK